MENKEIFRSKDFKVSLKQINNEYIFYVNFLDGKILKFNKEEFLSFLKDFINTEFTILSKKSNLKKAKLLFQPGNNNIYILFYNKWNIPVKIINLNSSNYLNEFKKLKKISTKDIIKAFRFQIFDLIDKYNSSYTDSLYLEIGNVKI